MGLFSSSSKASTTNYDQRQVAEGEAINVGSGANVSISSMDYKTQEVMGQLFGAVAESQVDAIKVIAGMGKDVIAQAGIDAREMYQQGSQNTAQAWGNTLEQAKELASNPSQDTNQTLTKVAYAAAAALAAFALFKR
jgi:hypothetical protein